MTVSLTHRRQIAPRGELSINSDRYSLRGHTFAGAFFALQLPESNRSRRFQCLRKFMLTPCEIFLVGKNSLTRTGLIMAGSELSRQ
jgi:hypothetical protein